MIKSIKRQLLVLFLLTFYHDDIIVFLHRTTNDIKIDKLFIKDYECYMDQIY